MINSRKILFFIIFILGISSFIIIFTFFSKPAPTRAGASDNVSGWAWAGVPQSSGGDKLGIGWISFNSNNCDTDDDGLSEGSSGCPPTGTIISSYGVNIEEVAGQDYYNLTGYAYYDMNDPDTSEDEVGWINFNPTVGDMPGSSDYSVRVSETGEVSGWARAVGHDSSWDGWIKLRNDSTESVDYGVSIDTNTGEFHGWAWGDDVMGWISFNCDNPESPDSCGTTNNYHVQTSFDFVNPPEITNFRIDTGGNPDYCSNQPQLGLTWDYTGETSQKAYEIKITGDINKTIRETGPAGSSDTCGIKITTTPDSNKLEVNYNGSYQVQGRVQDQDDNWSEWSASTISLLTTPHPWPDPDFDLIPTNPAVDEIASTTNTSQCHNPTSQCSSWLWAIPEGEFVGGSFATDKEPQLKFTSAGSNQEVTLKACDNTIPSASACCSKTRTFRVLYPMPDWTEE